MATQSGPTPWWQLPEYAGKSPVLTSPAPSGYTYDPVTMGYRPIAGSPSDMLAQRAREQSIADANRIRQQTLEDQQRSAADAMRARLMDMLNGSSASSSSGGSSSSYGGGSSTSFSMPAPASFNYNSGAGSAPNVPDVPDVAPVALPDTSAASAAAFARAKDKVGAETSASLTALRSALAGRGMLGGGGERRGVTRILTAGQANLGDTTREQAVSDVNRATDFAKMGYEGAISQRAQDVTQRGQTIASRNSSADRALSAASTDYSGQIAQRGQNISAADSAAGRDLTASEGAANRRLSSDLAAKTQRASSINTLISRLY